MEVEVGVKREAGAKTRGVRVTTTGVEVKTGLKAKTRLKIKTGLEVHTGLEVRYRLREQGVKVES